jgi:hypothetical protein
MSGWAHPRPVAGSGTRIVPHAQGTGDKRRRSDLT